MDVGLLDCHIMRNLVNLGYIILCQMSITLLVSNILLLYDNIITKILRHFQVPLSEPIYVENKRLKRKAIMAICFHLRNGQWVKKTLSENQNTLVALEDDRVLNDIYPTNQLPDFRLRDRT